MEKKDIKLTENNRMTLEQFKDEFYGEVGAIKRDKLETGYANFKAEALKKKPNLSIQVKTDSYLFS